MIDGTSSFVFVVVFLFLVVVVVFADCLAPLADSFFPILDIFVFVSTLSQKEVEVSLLCFVLLISDPFLVLRYLGQ